MAKTIQVRNARQHNLKGLDLEIPHDRMTVIAGPSGAGKSSLGFDILYAEGQRRYVGTFSPYARQFLERLDPPAVDAVTGLLPAVAVGRVNAIKTSRSTVGTLTELTDHLRVLFAQAAERVCPRTGTWLTRHTTAELADHLLGKADGSGLAIAFHVALDAPERRASLTQFFQAQGFTRIWDAPGGLDVIVARLRPRAAARERLVDALEQTLQWGGEQVIVHHLDADGASAGRVELHRGRRCPLCARQFRRPTPHALSFNTPVGACGACRGFGRVMRIDPQRVIPDPRLSLGEGAIKPFQSQSYLDCQRDLERHAAARGVSLTTPWQALPQADRDWVFAGDGDWESGRWYGVDAFFDWLEGRSYKMHVRVLLSRYRTYDPCPDCQGARVVPEVLLWRLASEAETTDPNFSPAGSSCLDDGQPPAALPGTSLADVLQRSVRGLGEWLDRLVVTPAQEQAIGPIRQAIRDRLDYLEAVGLDYLTLDRQARTLSGGEAQRINLTTALGARLVNTLFVLDEPTTGLHPVNTERLIGVLRALTDTGNTVVIIEHQARLISAADHVIELGPGPGEAGGQCVFSGPPEALLGADTATARWLRTPPPAPKRGLTPGAAPATITIQGARAHNLANVDVSIPLGGLVGLCGVSGSGKSTLAETILYRGLQRLLGEAGEPPGPMDGIEGSVTTVDFVDQSPLSRSARSTPGTYVKALDGIRKRFAESALAQDRGYTPRHFSFNDTQADGGACPVCRGAGKEHVEMLFLADVYLDCPACQGRRFRPEILEVYLPGAAGAPDLNIHDVLQLSVDAAATRFADTPSVTRPLAALQRLGLGYLRLGQPTPTLAGGESQRLKLAGHLARRRPGRRRGEPGHDLLILDEPSNGLHGRDVAQLLEGLQALVDDGVSLVLVEHHLDLLAACDWLIELGPGGGQGGGRVLFTGPPPELAESDTPTGRALRAARRDWQARVASPTRSALAEAPASYAAERAGAAAEKSDSAAGAADADSPTGTAPGTAPSAATAIVVRDAREHNLQGIDVTIPRETLTVITGVSGSGKSTLAFDILFSEGQRRYLETLDAYARQFTQPPPRPHVEAVLGLPPTVAIAQRQSQGGPRSTVATLSEIDPFLRLLYWRLGTAHCPDCGTPVTRQDAATMAQTLVERFAGRAITLLASLVRRRKGRYDHLARWARERGYTQLWLDGQWVATDAWPPLRASALHTIALPVAHRDALPARPDADLHETLARALRVGHGTVDVLVDGTAALTLSEERICLSCGRGLPEPDPRLWSANSAHGWCPSCEGLGTVADAPCPDCGGARLNPIARGVTVWGINLPALVRRSVDGLQAWLTTVAPSDRERAIAKPILAGLQARLGFLQSVGLGYLSLDRTAPTLSGGEAQRIRLAAQLGGGLEGVCYVLDEPTIGLHARDTARLLDALATLRAHGNTVIMVEHEAMAIRRADHVLDLGPGAGPEGGRVVAAGTVDTLIATQESVTGRCLAQPPRTLPKARPRSKAPSLTLYGASRHNVRDVTVEIPLARVVAVTGVSGSGKSTLVRQILKDDLTRALQGAALAHCQALETGGAVGRVLEVDTTPIGRSPRSCPATFLDLWDPIRRLLAATEEARMRGFTAARFSFNRPGGRCETCEGQGVIKVEMSFLPDMEIPCEVCRGLRFGEETLKVRYAGYNAGELLDLPARTAKEVFAAHRTLATTLGLLDQIGLGYLRLGQPSPTLSGGEAQRLKLVAELAKSRPRRPPGARGAAGEADAGPNQRTLYLLDEPSIGLHMADVQRLTGVLDQLVDAGHSVIVIEHDLDLISQADWILDLGPGPGPDGGHVIACGTPRQLARRATPTGRALKAHVRLES